MHVRSAGVVVLTAALIALLSPLCRAEETKLAATINVRTDQVIGTVNPDIYGHFT